MSTIYLLGGGTVFHLRPHFALSAPAYGKTALQLADVFDDHPYQLNDKYKIHLGLTKMAVGAIPITKQTALPPCHLVDMIGETNAEVETFVDKIIADKEAKIVFMSVALCDFEGTVGTFASGTPDPRYYGNGFLRTKSGKGEPRLKSDSAGLYVELTQANKIISKIRKTRKDIFLIGCKTTAGASEEVQYEAGLSLLKKNSCNLVLANDVQTGLNMIICPELAVYSVTHDRTKVLKDLVDIAMNRSTNEFARTTVVDGSLLAWTAQEVPENLRKVVDWCVEQGAYQAFNNVTVGHFGFKPEDPNVLFSSRRKQNFNLPECRDLVKVKFSDKSQMAFGAKPSAGARSQYMVLGHFPQYDCIVHFHCPMKPEGKVPTRPQKMFECGSHQCGINTFEGMKDYGGMAAVMLDKHGPNIVFSKNADPNTVIEFIKENFDLTKRTR